MAVQTIQLADLQLDSENPRHDPASDQAQILDALLEQVGDKVAVLAEDIAEHGVSPIDVPLVLKKGSGTASAYIVIEGNRRIAALKLLDNPALTPRSRLNKRFTALAKKMAAPIPNVDCVVVTSRDEARHWQELRHQGEFDGRGVVTWDAIAKARFFGRTSADISRGMALADAMEAAYPTNSELRANLKEIRKERISTLGRLFDPDTRRDLGVVIQDKNVSAHYTSADLERVFMRITKDLARGRNDEGVTVSDLKKKADRQAYLTKLVPLFPERAKRLLHATPLATIRTTPPSLPSLPAPVAESPVADVRDAGLVSTDPPIKTPPPGPRHLFEGVALTKFSPRIRNILGEAQRLELERYPNASAVLARVVLDLALTEVFEKNRWPLQVTKPGKQPQDKPLSKLVNECLAKIDPSNKDPKWKAIRSGLTNPDSILAMATLNAWVHNAHFMPSGSDLRSISVSYGAFLTALDGLV